MSFGSPPSARSRSVSPRPLSLWALKHYDMPHRPATGKRPVSAFLKMAATEEPEVPVETQREVRRDIFGKRLYDAPKFVPGGRATQWNPEHTDRAAAFRKELARALMSDDMTTLLAVYSMAMDVDAANYNSQLVFTSSHEVDAIQKHIRNIFKKQIKLAIEAGDVEGLKAMFEETDKVKLLKATVSTFPEVHRGRAYLCLRIAHLDLENHNNDDEEGRMKKVKALQGATRNARPIRGMTRHIEESRRLLARQRERASAPPEKVNTRGSLPSTTASVTEETAAEEADASQESSAAEEAPPEKVNTRGSLPSTAASVTEETAAEEADASQESSAAEDEAAQDIAGAEDDAVEEQPAEEAEEEEEWDEY